MGDVLRFPSNRRQDKEVVRIKKLADELDQLILHWVEMGVQPHELAGIMAHRLGSLIRHVEDVEVLTEFCKELVTRQANPVDTDAS